MNGNWYPWGVGTTPPGAYVAAWRHIVRVFRSEGATNVRFVWAPNAEHESQRAILRLYPGDRWVDWVALSGFNWGGPWLWESAQHVFRRSYLALTRLTRKPLMIAETSAGEVGGSKPKWIAQTFSKDLRRMPRVRAVVWFNGQLNWARWDADSSRASLNAFRTAVAPAHYGAGAALVEGLSKTGVTGR
jgi:endoglucanase